MPRGRPGGQVKPKELRLRRKCKTCRGPIVLAMHKGVPERAYREEEFCSSTCAREFHGTQILVGPAGRAKGMGPMWERGKRGKRS